MGRKHASKKRSKVQEYKALSGISMAAVSAAFMFFSGVEKVKTMLAAFDSGTPSLQSILPFALFVITILLGIAWFASGTHELSLLTRHYDAHAPSRSFSTIPVIICVPIVVVVLALWSNNIFAYSCIYAVYLFFNAIASWLTTQHVLTAINNGKTDTSIPIIYRKEIYRYYIQRPTSVLGYVCGALTFTAITTAWLSRLSQAPVDQQRFQTMAYCAMISSILLGEAVVWTWRALLYCRIREEENALRGEETNEGNGASPISKDSEGE